VAAPTQSVSRDNKARIAKIRTERRQEENLVATGFD
jgi:hypothetical protein